MTGRDQPQAGIPAQHIGREAAGNQLALAVLGREEDHQPPATPLGDAIQLVRQHGVVPVGLVVGLGELRESEQASPRPLPLCA